MSVCARARARVCVVCTHHGCNKRTLPSSSVNATIFPLYKTRHVLIIYPVTRKFRTCGLTYEWGAPSRFLPNRAVLNVLRAGSLVGPGLDGQLTGYNITRAAIESSGGGGGGGGIDVACELLRSAPRFFF